MPDSLNNCNWLNDFDGAADERESKLHFPRNPVTGRKMNPEDVVNAEEEEFVQGERPRRSPTMLPKRHRTRYPGHSHQRR